MPSHRRIYLQKYSKPIGTTVGAIVNGTKVDPESYGATVDSNPNRATVDNPISPMSDVACPLYIPPNVNKTKSLKQCNELDISAQLIHTGQSVINETKANKLNNSTEVGNVDLSNKHFNFSSKKPLFINGTNDTDDNNQEISSLSKIFASTQVTYKSKNKSTTNNLNRCDPQDMTNNTESTGNNKNNLINKIMYIDLSDEESKKNITIDESDNDTQPSQVPRKRFKGSENNKNKVEDQIIPIDDKEQSKNLVNEDKSNNKHFYEDSAMARKKFKASKMIKNCFINNKNKVGDLIILDDTDDESENVVHEDKSNDKNLDEDSMIARKKFKTSEIIKNGSVNNKNVEDQIVCIDDEDDQSGSGNDSDDDSEKMSCSGISQEAIMDYIKKKKYAKLNNEKMTSKALLNLFCEDKGLNEQASSFIIFKFIQFLTKRDGYGKKRAELQAIEQNQKEWKEKFNKLEEEYKAACKKTNEHMKIVDGKNIKPLDKYVRTVGLQTDLEEDDESSSLKQSNSNIITVSDDNDDDDDDVIFVEIKDSSSSSQINTKKKDSPKPSTSTMPLLSTTTTEIPSMLINSSASTNMEIIDLTENDEIKQNTSKTLVTSSTQLIKTKPPNGLSNNAAYFEYSQISISPRYIQTNTSASNSNQHTLVSSLKSTGVDPNSIILKVGNRNLVPVRCTFIGPNHLRPSSSGVTYTTGQFPAPQITRPQVLRTQLTRSLQLNSHQPSRPRQLNRRVFAPVPPAIPLSIYSQYPPQVPSVHNRSLPLWKRVPLSPTVAIEKKTGIHGDISFMLTFSMDDDIDNNLFAEIKSFEIFTYQCENGGIPKIEMWQKCGIVNVDVPLPMSVILNHFIHGIKYHVTTRAVDIHGCIGPFSVPQLVFYR